MTNQPQWEIDFDLLWGLSPDDSLKGKKGKDVKDFIRTQIAEAEARGKQEGADIAMVVKLSSQDQLLTYVAGLASVLLPIQYTGFENQKKHNEAVLKLSNIKNNFK